MFKRLYMKKIKELEARLAILQDRNIRLQKELDMVNAANYKYRRVYSKLFDGLPICNVVSYEVKNDLVNGKVIFDVKYNDGLSYTYEVVGVFNGYAEVLENGKIE